MGQSNRKRLLMVYEILKKYSDDRNSLSASFILNQLSEANIFSNRKSIYEDIKILSEHFDIDKDSKSYHFINENPFNIVELKLLSDSINSAKFLSKKEKLIIHNKLKSLCSNHYQAFLKLDNTSNNNENIYYLIAMIIEALLTNKALVSLNEIIIPYHLLRENDHYYLVYEYLNKSKFYFRRLDRLKEKYKLMDTDHPKRSEAELNDFLTKQLQMFHSAITRIKIKIIDPNYELIIKLLNDDFKDLSINKDKSISLSISMNHIGFSLLSKYEKRIKVIEPNHFIKSYSTFLESILKAYKNQV